MAKLSTKPAPKQRRINWNNLYLDFLKQQTHTDVRSFLVERFGEKAAYNGHYKSKTVGWAESRNKFYEEAKKSIIEKESVEFKEALAIPRRQLEQDYEFLASMIRVLLQEKVTIDPTTKQVTSMRISAKEMATLQTIMHRFLGMPDSYNKTENVKSVDVTSLFNKLKEEMPQAFPERKSPFPEK